MLRNGVVNMLKPPGMTSFKMAAFVKHCLGGIKTGHTGTLDPDAAGVLPICIGKATRAASLLMGMEKVYRAEMLLGVSTDTLDTSGRLIKMLPVTARNSEIEEAVCSMKGEQLQVPPMFSAVSINGTRMYELARRGVEAERTPRQINIISIEVLSIKIPKVIFEIKCSKGTYVRKVCSDIGEKLGCGACMSFLLRISSGGFKLENACTMEEFKELTGTGRVGECIEPVGNYLSGYNKIILYGKDITKFTSGAKLTINAEQVPEEGILSVFYDEAGSFLGYSNDIIPVENGFATVGRRNVIKC